MNLFRIKILYLVMFIQGFVYGQSSSFEYSMNTSNDERVFDIIENVNNEIIFSGTCDSFGDKKYSGLIVKLNDHGDFIDSSVLRYKNKSCLFSSIIKPYNSENYINVGRITDTGNIGYCYNQAFILNFMDSNLVFSNPKTYLINPEYNINMEFGSIGFDDKIFVSGNINKASGYIKPYIYQFDKFLDSINAKIYLDENETFSQIHYLTNNQYWLIGCLHNKYYVVDSLLNITFEEDNGYRLGGNISFKWDSDSSFYLLGFRIASENSDDVGFVKQFHPTDTSGYLFNSFGKVDTIDLPAVYQAIDFKNKDSIYFGGSSNVWSTYYGNWPSWYFIIQTDSMLNIRWERFYGGDAYYMMAKVLATNDGGCLLAGTKYDYENTDEEQLDIYVVKVNSEGLVTGNQDKPVPNAHEAIVFPNPGTNELKVRVAFQHPESVIQLFDMNGKQVLQQNINGQWGEVNTSFLVPGTYLYRISNDRGLFESGKWVKQ